MIDMVVLVTYASKHGATGGIAERIAQRLRGAGHDVDLRPVAEAGDVSGYDGFVIGAATYMGHWRKDATAFVRRNEELLAHKPVWLFSSGPLGTEKTDPQGRDLHETAVPEEMAELTRTVRPREEHVFFGALDPAELTFGERTVRRLPAARAVMPEGDFRDWTEIENWADGIARELDEAGV